MRSIRNSFRFPLAALSTAALALTLAAGAQPAAAQMSPGAPGMGGPGMINPSGGSYHAMRANDIVGSKFMSPQNHELGTVKDLVFVLPSAETRYAVVKFDGDNYGKQLYIVPMHFLQPANANQAGNQDGTLVYRGMDPRQLGAASIADDDWGPDVLHNRNLWARVDHVWGTPMSTSNSPALLASTLLDEDVKTANGKNIGEIQSVVVNLGDGRAHYAVVEFDPGWLSPEHKIALPLQALHISPQQGELQVNLTRNDAKNLQELDRNWYKRLNDPQFVSNIDHYLVASGPTFYGRQQATAGGATATGQAGMGYGNQQQSQGGPGNDGYGGYGAAGYSGYGGYNGYNPYNSGYNTGFNNGYNPYNNGFNAGYNNGYNPYNNGYAPYNRPNNGYGNAGFGNAQGWPNGGGVGGQVGPFGAQAGMGGWPQGGGAGMGANVGPVGVQAGAGYGAGGAGFGMGAGAGPVGAQAGAGGGQQGAGASMGAGAGPIGAGANIGAGPGGAGAGIGLGPFHAGLGAGPNGGGAGVGVGPYGASVGAGR